MTKLDKIKKWAEDNGYAYQAWINDYPMEIKIELHIFHITDEWKHQEVCPENDTFVKSKCINFWQQIKLTYNSQKNKVEQMHSELQLCENIESQNQMKELQIALNRVKHDEESLKNCLMLDEVIGSWQRKHGVE